MNITIPEITLSEADLDRLADKIASRLAQSDTKPTMLSQQELAEHLGVSVSTLTRKTLHERGFPQSIGTGRGRRWSREAVDGWLQRRCG